MARNLALDKVSLDTHALYWFFEDPGKLSPIAKRVLEAQPEIVISVIVLFELLYIEKKSNGFISLAKILRHLKNHKHKIVPVDEKVFNRAGRIKRI